MILITMLCCIIIHIIDIIHKRAIFHLGFNVHAALSCASGEMSGFACHLPRPQDPAPLRIFRKIINSGGGGRAAIKLIFTTQLIYVVKKNDFLDFYTIFRVLCSFVYILYSIFGITISKNTISEAIRALMQFLHHLCIICDKPAFFIHTLRFRTSI